ncbi:exo-alpha-sialidase [Membranihabitans marinus]|uniref:exo-alpha-sialidase n=1 Tax=Membranihabitans marinus TaxID=1227546 RepID=UPI001F35E59A|nr:exo-alpha-sialidase [Membranihabitans marinus]
MLKFLIPFCSIILISLFFSCTQRIDYPDPQHNPESTLMLEGDWFDHPHDIDFLNLPKLPMHHIVVSDVRGSDTANLHYNPKASGGVNQHNYLYFYDNQYWLMWSDGPGVEDRVGQVVKYSTSKDGLDWAEPKLLTPYPPQSDTTSSYYNTRSDNGYRWISRGFWEYEGNLLALVSLDEANGFFGESLELRAFKWDKHSERWSDKGLIMKNAINNFPPKKIPSGEWLMSRRSYDYVQKGVDFMVGGLTSKDDWEVYPVLGSNSELSAEEPYWWVLPDGKSLMALFRDNKKSGYLYRAFSTDNGRNWTTPVQTNFPDAASKFYGLRLEDGRYVLISNPNPERRDPLALSISNDGLVFDKMAYLVGHRPPFQLDYPHAIEHNGYLLIAFSGSTKQKIEVLIIKISDLDLLDMSKYKSN